MKTFVIVETVEYEIKAKSHEGARAAFIEMGPAHRGQHVVAVRDRIVYTKYTPGTKEEKK